MTVVGQFLHQLREQRPSSGETQKRRKAETKGLPERELLSELTYSIKVLVVG